MGGGYRKRPLDVALTARGLAGALLLLSIGCRRNDAAATSAEASAPAAASVGSVAPAVSSASDVAVAVAGVAEGDASSEAAAPVGNPYARLPSLESAPNAYAGFSKDDRYLGYQISTCGTCPEEFHFVGPGVPKLSFRYFYDPTLDQDVREKREKAHDAEVERKLAALGVQKIKDGRVLRGPFPYPDLTFAVKTSRNTANGKVTLHFGARVGAEAPVYPIRIDLGPHPMVRETERDPDWAKLTPSERAKRLEESGEAFSMDEPMLAYANVTKDGHEIGVVATARGSGFYEAGGVARMDVEKFVGEVRAGTKPRRDAGP